jgi:hypothetical protein
VGAEVRREDHQSTAAIFHWFLRILASNLKSRCPTSSLTRMKVSLSRPSAIQHPWATCEISGPTTKYSNFIFIFITWISGASPFDCSILRLPKTLQKGSYMQGRALLTYWKSPTAEQLLFQRLGSHCRIRCLTLEMTVLDGLLLTGCCVDRLPHGVELLEVLSHLLTRFR